MGSTVHQNYDALLIPVVVEFVTLLGLRSPQCIAEGCRGP